MYLHIISRAIAKERGYTRFFTGEPCKLGHIAQRNTKSTTCMICDAEKKAAYRQKFPDQAKESLRKSANKHRDARRADNKAWREKNSEALKQSKKRYAEENREKVLAAKKDYYAKNKEKCLLMSRSHKEKNKDRYKELNKIWRQNNKEKVSTLNRNRKRKIIAAFGIHTADDVINLFNIQKKKCAGCRRSLVGINYHVDHIQPLALGGSNWPSNLQIMCPTCNMSKGGRPPEQFYQKMGFLL